MKHQLLTIIAAISEGKTQFLHQANAVILGRDDEAQGNRVDRSGFHFHSHWEIKLLLRGEHPFCSTSEQRNFKAPGILLVPPNLPHVSDMENIAANTQLISLTFDPDDTTATLMENTFSEETFLQDEDVINWTLLLRQQPHDYLEDAIIKNLRSADSPSHHFARSSLLCLLSSMRMVLEKRDHVKRLSRAERIAMEARAMIQNNYHDADFSVKRIAAKLKVSERYLLQSFTRITGSSIRQAIIKYRMEKACEFLRSGRYSVKEVAYLTGWRTPFYFSNSFKRIFNQSPSEYSE